MRLFLYAGAAMMIAGLCPMASAQAPSEFEWPCVQQKVPVVAASTVWSGPDLEEVGSWQADSDAALLVQRLASRRTRTEEIDPLIEAFAEQAGERKAERLTRVFAGVLDVINTERSRIIAGIERYARGQNELAEKIREEADKITAAKDGPATEPTKELQELETRFQWDKRIFEERSHALSSVCETPVLLEQRLFEIARSIQQHL